MRRIRTARLERGARSQSRDQSRVFRSTGCATWQLRRRDRTEGASMGVRIEREAAWPPSLSDLPVFHAGSDVAHVEPGNGQTGDEDDDQGREHQAYLAVTPAQSTEVGLA